MIFSPTSLPGLIKVELEPIEDERGFFARTFCAQEFASHGLVSQFEQTSLSHNNRHATLRGMHFQAAPHVETKFVRCVRGAVFDVAVDLRPSSSTHRKWAGETLSAENGIGLYIPPGFAHGFLTLTDDADVLYQISPAYRAGFGRGVRWDDPAFAIDWPERPSTIAERDAAYPDYRA